MLNSHPNASAPARPVSAGRVRELLDLLREFGGDHIRFRGAANMAAVMGSGFAGREGRMPELPRMELFGSDPRAVLEDFERLTWLWGLTVECWTGAAGGRACAREKIAGSLAYTRDPGAHGLWGVFPGVMDAQARQLRSVTDDELDALGELSGELAAALHPDRSAVLREMAAARAEPQPDPEVVQPGDPEARVWISSNGQDAPLAANRFDREDALAFVDELYAAGAVRVVIASECIRDDEAERAIGGPYADGLRVRLPSEPARRAAVLAIANREEEEEGFDPTEDTGQEVVFLWWD